LTQAEAIVYGVVMNVARKFNTRVFLNKNGRICVRPDVYDGIAKLLLPDLRVYLIRCISDEMGVT
jgi:hypothetical protein